MNCLVRQIQKKWFVAICFLKKINCFPRQQRCDVSILRHPLPVIINRIAIIGRVILALTFEAKPIVKSRSGIITRMAHMPLPNKPCLVSCFLEILWKEQRAVGHWSLVVDHSMTKCIEACQNRGSAGRAQRRRHVCIFEMGPFFHHRIHMWCFCKWVSHKAHCVIAMVIRKNENHIPRVCSFDSCRNHRIGYRNDICVNGSVENKSNKNPFTHTAQPSHMTF